MSEPRQKDWLDIAIDFFLGAVFSDIVIGYAILTHGQGTQLNWNQLWMPLLATTLITGSLAGLCRDTFWLLWSAYFAPGTQSDTTPTDERVARTARIVLWCLFALGCASLGLLFIW